MVSGISTTTNNEAELSEENGKIPLLWDEYVENSVDNKTFNKANSKYFYGIYSNYASDENGDYKYTIGVEVTKPKNAIVIENQRYLVFSKQGEFPGVVLDAWKDVWAYFAGTPEYTRAFKIDFEKYVEETEVEIYISIL